jgi:NADPH2:quinone reductase
VCPVAATFDMPDEIPLPDAAALYFPFHLAWLGLFDRAELRAGESVLVHAAAGGSGSAAVQLAHHAGAKVIATAGTDEKVQLCRDLGADVAVNYTTGDFAEAVMAETGGRGVDVVFDNVGEAVLDASLSCAAYNGRYLLMGFASNKAVADEPLVVPRRLSMGNLRLCGVVLNYADPGLVGVIKGALGWNIAPRALGERIHGEVLDLVRAGAVRAVVGREVPFDDLPSAIDAMARRETVGRTVVLL